MAIFHLSGKMVGKSYGGQSGRNQSAVRSAAYIAGDSLECNEDGKVYDYTSKKEVTYREVMLPRYAPREYADREYLWNAVEKRENDNDRHKEKAQYAREIEVALPKELEGKEHIELLRTYIKENFVDKGMIADWSIHNKLGNPHAHILLTLRDFTEKGEWGTKTKIRYKLDEFGDKIPLIDPDTGEQKLGPRNTKKWVREDIQGWGCAAQLVEWRKNWAEACNKYLVPRGIDPIDHRSYKERGLDIEPTIHEGIAAREIEARGGDSWKCERNREIIERRSLIEMAVEAFGAAKEWLGDKIEKMFGGLKHGKFDRFDEGIDSFESKYREAVDANYNRDERRELETFFREFGAEEQDFYTERRESEIERIGGEIEGQLENGRVDRG